MEENFDIRRDEVCLQEVIDRALNVIYCFALMIEE